jgi:hypothetical protein
MLECEAKYLLGKPIEERREYLKHKNVAGRVRQLKEEMVRIWKR